jgi:hypothetical protein
MPRGPLEGVSAEESSSSSGRAGARNYEAGGHVRSSGMVGVMSREISAFSFLAIESMLFGASYPYSTCIGDRA